MNAAKKVPAGCGQNGRHQEREWMQAAEACTELGHTEPRRKWAPLANVLAICWAWLTDQRGKPSG